MKHLLLCLLLLAPCAARAQDSAAIVVGRYLRLLNAEALPSDSLLIIETTITYRDSRDTHFMRRYYQAPAMMRVEVWQADTLTAGLCTNGTSRFRQYNMLQGWWNDLSEEEFSLALQAYDPRSPLFNYAARGITLSYTGIILIEGHPFHVVRAEQRDHYNRSYFFDRDSGLLTLITESYDMPAGSHRPMQSLPPIEYKFIHQYQPLGESLIPSEESFRREGVLHILNSTLHLAPRNNLLFNQD